MLPALPCQGRRSGAQKAGFFHHLQGDPQICLGPKERNVVVGGVVPVLQVIKLGTSKRGNVVVEVLPGDLPQSAIQVEGLLRKGPVLPGLLKLNSEDARNDGVENAPLSAQRRVWQERIPDSGPLPRWACSESC